MLNWERIMIVGINSFIGKMCGGLNLFTSEVEASRPQPV